MGQRLGRRAGRTAAVSRSLGRMEGVGGCRGEEWPHSQSILLEEPGCQEGPPWVWPAVLPGTGCCPAPLVRGAGSLLAVLLLSASREDRYISFLYAHTS